MKILVKIKSYLSVYYLSPELGAEKEVSAPERISYFFVIFLLLIFVVVVFSMGGGHLDLFFIKVLVFRILQVLGSITGHYLS